MESNENGMDFGEFSIDLNGKTIRCIEMLIWYDCPLLWLGKDDDGQQYYIQNCSPNDDKEAWDVVPIKDNRWFTIETELKLETTKIEEHG